MMDERMDGVPPVPVKDKRARNPQKWIHLAIAKYRDRKYQLAHRPDDGFFELADAVVVPKLTLLGYDRLYAFWQVVRNVSGVPGAVAEIGSYRGGSAFFIASAFMAVAREAVPMHVFDTFEGHPEAAVSAHDSIQSVGRFQETSEERVRSLLKPFPHVQVHKGDVSASLPQLEELAYRLVHVDVDLYAPTVTCLEYFGARLSRGGVIVVDDYASPKCDGVPKAVTEYLERHPGEYQTWDLRTEQLLLVKR